MVSAGDFPGDIIGQMNNQSPTEHPFRRSVVVRKGQNIMETSKWRHLGGGALLFAAILLQSCCPSVVGAH